jgi:hypothetical protein
MLKDSAALRVLERCRQGTRLLFVVGICSSLAAPSFGDEKPPATLSKVEILDVNRTLEPDRGRQRDRQVFSLEARSKEDRRFIGRLWQVYGPVFRFEDWSSFGPDSSYRQIRLIHRGKVLTLSSWHPIVEQNSTHVATSYGVISLDGRSRGEVLKAGDPDYFARRSAFDAIVDRCLAHNKAPQRTTTAGSRR